MTSMTARTDILMSSQCRHLTARISREALETRLEEKLGRRLTVPLQFDLEVASDSDFGRGWRQLLAHVCELSASAPIVLASEDMRRQYSRTMIEMLIHSAAHNYAAALEKAVTHPIPWHVRRARDYVHSNIAEVFSVAGLAASVGVATRTLEIGFRKTFNMTPAAYIRRTRVQALHQSLLSSNGRQSVTELMQALGIVNFGRFARYYSQQIGEPPSATLRRRNS